jgi:hypothetical protein
MVGMRLAVERISVAPTAKPTVKTQIIPPVQKKYYLMSLKTAVR